MSKNIKTDARDDARIIPQARAGAKRGVTLVEGVRKLGGLGTGERRLEPAAIEIGERIRSERQAAGLTQMQLAKKIGCKQGDLSDIERGRGRDGPSFRVLRAIADALGIALPINPYAAEPVSVEVSASEDVQHGSADFSTLDALFSPREWGGLRKYCHDHLKLPLIGRAAQRCTFVTMGPNARLDKMVADTRVVVVLVRGDGAWKTHGDVVRNRKPHSPGYAMAVLEHGAWMEAKADVEAGLSIVAFPTDALLRGEADEFSAA
ncbi:helix-turn-helix domain-containing protein [Sphingopyxis fribergensis]